MMPFDIVLADGEKNRAGTGEEMGAGSPCNCPSNVFSRCYLCAPLRHTRPLPTHTNAHNPIFYLSVIDCGLRSHTPRESIEATCTLRVHTGLP